MKIEDTNQDSMELGFEIPEPGLSVCKFDEGVQKRTNEISGKTTLQLPLTIDQVIEGPEENVGKKMSHFVPIETSFGEKQLNGILTMTGLVNSFAKKFGDEVEATDDRFINAIKLKLPDKFVTVHHDVRKDNKGRDQVNIVKFERFGKGKPAASKSVKKTDNSDAGNEDW